jgi:eukaryotic-like serine/threonine-protein kinase
LPAIGADHNLLVGVLALQLNFVTREELIDAACESAGADKPQALLEAFRQRGALSADECDLLGALVDRHLARHNNDPQQSLAACDGAGEVRELITALEQATRLSASSRPRGSTRGPTREGAAADTIAFSATEPDPHATRVDDPRSPAPRADQSDPAIVSPSAPTMAYSLFEAQRAAKLAPAVPDPAGPQSQSAASRFRILRAFQKGGLGQVSLAHDGELNREVALKEILPRHADSGEARQRFLMEAEITGSLEHPGVVPVYGLGQYADGRPFYAMRLIRGDNMQLAIDEFYRQPTAPDRELRFRQLLARFVAVCNAIEYAHNRGVLHRDLKPSNIMLGKYGETLVVDWGLAKAMGAGAAPSDTVELPVKPASADASTETQMGRVVGTPAYMSPEQASGRVDMLAPATDVYSLGATLYHLLVGQAPFSFEDRDALLGNVQMGRFDPPRARRPETPKPLEAICLKAMARKPAGRYVSARAMADDVERYLADEPVAAYAEPVSARIWRWMRRHRAAVVGTGAVLSVVATSLAIGVVLLGAANRRAEHNFELARNAIRDYYITVSEDTLLDQPGMQPLREQLLRRALEYYQEFLATQRPTGDLLDELAQANFFAGRITESIDSPDDAIAFYEKAANFNSQLVAKTPNDEKRLYDQAQTHNALGGALLQLNRLDESDKYYEKAEAARQKLVADHPDNVEYVRTLANTIMNRGSISDARGDAPTAVKRWQQAQQLRTSRLASGKASPKLRADAGKGAYNLGKRFLDEGKLEEARKHLIEAVASFEEVRKQAPDDLDSQYSLALSYRKLGDLQTEGATTIASAAQPQAPPPETSPPDDSEQSPPDALPAMPFYDKAAELLATLSLRNPTVSAYQSDFSGIQIDAAQMLLDGGEPEKARAAIDQATSALNDLLQRSPDDPDLALHQRDLAVAWRVSALIHMRQNDDPAAAADARRAVALLESLVAQTPTDEDFREQLELAKTTLEEAE